MKIKPELRELDFQWFREELKAYGFSEETIHEASLILEEMLINIIKYSETEADIIFNATYSKNRIKIRIADQGRKFNPLKDYSPELGQSIKDSKVGGLGIHIIKQLADKVVYKRIGRFNIFSAELKVEDINSRTIRKTKNLISSTMRFVQNTHSVIINPESET